MTEGEKKFSGHWQKGCTHFDELKGLDDEIRSAMTEQTAFMRNSVPVVSGRYPVVLSPEAAGVFAHESFDISLNRISCSPMKPCAMNGS